MPSDWVPDAGPIATPPEKLGLCTEHGWWWQLPKHSTGEACPQPGCRAKTLLYARSGVYTPPQEAEDA